MTTTLRLLVLLACGMLGACAGVAPAPPEIHVALPRPAAVPTPATASLGVWRVAPYGAAGPYRERAMVYSEDDGRSLQQHPYQYWVDSPPRLCRDALMVALREAGIGSRVVANADPSAAFEVRGRVIAFDRLMSAAGSSARLALELEVVDTGSREVRLSRRYEERQPAVDNDAVGTAAAAAAALDAIHRRFVADALQALRTR